MCNSASACYLTTCHCMNTLLSAEDEKKHAAISSVLWSFLLTVIKLVAGFATNSLGILSEALHSALDLGGHARRVVKALNTRRLDQAVQRVVGIEDCGHLCSPRKGTYAQLAPAQCGCLLAELLGINPVGASLLAIF